MGSKLEQERQARFEEVRALQAKLDEQELRYQTAEEKSMREKKKRKRAEERVQELRSEIMKHKEDLGDDGIIFKGTERGHKKLMTALEGKNRELNRLHRAVEDRSRTIKELRAALAERRQVP